MRFLIKILLVAALAFGLGLVLPYWSAALAAFIVALLMSRKPKRRIFATKKQRNFSFSFFAGFIGVFIVWALVAYSIDQANHSILSPKVAALILQDASKGFLMILLTGAFGGFLGGLGAMTGNYLGAALRG